MEQTQLHPQQATTPPAPTNWDRPFSELKAAGPAGEQPAEQRELPEEWKQQLAVARTQMAGGEEEPVQSRLRAPEHHVKPGAWRRFAKKAGAYALAASAAIGLFSGVQQAVGEHTPDKTPRYEAAPFTENHATEAAPEEKQHPEEKQEELQQEAPGWGATDWGSIATAANTEALADETGHETDETEEVKAKEQVSEAEQPTLDEATEQETPAQVAEPNAEIPAEAEPAQEPEQAAPQPETPAEAEPEPPVSEQPTQEQPAEQPTTETEQETNEPAETQDNDTTTLADGESPTQPTTSS